jgi:putative NIF3 family GTP cyclohydrolase 1 type 2
VFPSESGTNICTWHLIADSYPLAPADHRAAPLQSVTTDSLNNSSPSPSEKQETERRNNLFKFAPLWVTHFQYLDGCKESGPPTGVAGDDRTPFEVLDNFCYFEVLGLFKGVPVVCEIISSGSKMRVSELLIAASTSYGVGIGESWLKQAMAPMQLEFGPSLSNFADRVRNALNNAQFQHGCETCERNIVATIILKLQEGIGKMPSGPSQRLAESKLSDFIEAVCSPFARPRELLDEFLQICQRNRDQEQVMRLGSGSGSHRNQGIREHRLEAYPAEHVRDSAIPRSPNFRSDLPCFRFLVTGCPYGKTENGVEMCRFGVHS